MSSDRCGFFVAGLGATLTARAITPVPPDRLAPAARSQGDGSGRGARRALLPRRPGDPLDVDGATDGVFLEAIGIPTYGVPGPWGDPDGDGVHGLNERIGVRSLMVGRDYLTDLVRAYAGS